LTLKASELTLQRGGEPDRALWPPITSADAAAHVARRQASAWVRALKKVMALQFGRWWIGVSLRQNNVATTYPYDK
jgi:hypothetical protein